MEPRDFVFSTVEAAGRTKTDHGGVMM